MPEKISIDNIGNISVLKNVAQQTIPLFLSLPKSSLIFLIFIKGTTANITIIPNVALGRSYNRGVANSSVSITIRVVVIDEIGLYDPTDSLTADLENEPDTGYEPEKLDVMLPRPCPNNS